MHRGCFPLLGISVELRKVSCRRATQSMSTKKRNRGPSLPKSILEHIDRHDASGVCTKSFIHMPLIRNQVGQGHPHRNKGKNIHLSRKDARKQERLDRKKRRADHLSTTAVDLKRKAEEEYADVPYSKRRKTDRFADEVKSSSPPQIHNTRPPRGPSEPSDSSTSTKTKSKFTALEKLASKSTPKAPKVASRVLRTREEAEEDAYIAYLEAKLGYSNGAKRRKGDEVDGLAGGYMHSQYYGPGHAETCTQICSTLPMGSRSPSWMSLATLTPNWIETLQKTRILGTYQTTGSLPRWVKHQTTTPNLARQTAAATKTRLKRRTVTMNGLVLAQVTTVYPNTIRLPRILTSQSPRYDHRVRISLRVSAMPTTHFQGDTSRPV